jgi:hypothetical protein
MIPIRRRALHRLSSATAEGFDVSMPSGRGLSHRQYLQCYAQFTRGAAERALEQGKDLNALRARLRATSFALGDRVRRHLHLRSPRAVMTAARLLYRFIGIDFRGSSGGEVRVTSCFFSDYYTPSVCRLISSLDDGLLSGLAGGGSLTFQRRLTEGHPCCEARFAFEDKRE